jgi:DNA (cytosine-5)-methyltransferase 1
MVSYYNEIDPYAAQWLRNLIANKLIADGDVDERSIRDVAAADLHGYTQCHFFAGIGVWSYALRLAGWSDDRPVWTGSCPCQPFSAAGKGKGFDDDRHLWPEFHRLIAECRPPVVFGEQVASKDGLGWLDTVHTDMEASGYAIGAADLCAAGIGAPHIRQRLWFVGERLDDTAGARHVGALAGAEGEARDEARLRLSGEGCGSGGLADAEYDDRRADEPGRGPQGRTADGWSGADGGLADACNDGPQGWVRGGPNEGRQTLDGSAGRDGADCRPSPTDGHWRDADWLFCRDGKWRPVEPGTFPLAHGAPARVGRLRGYGNALNAVQAQVFVEEVMQLAGE